MIIVDRLVGQSVMVDDFTVKVLSVKGTKVKMEIIVRTDANKADKDKIYRKILRENKTKAIAAAE
jgi:sRNA-binding carbon storage regulator CsrA